VRLDWTRRAPTRIRHHDSTGSYRRRWKLPRARRHPNQNRSGIQVVKEAYLDVSVCRRKPSARSRYFPSKSHGFPLLSRSPPPRRRKARHTTRRPRCRSPRDHASASPPHVHTTPGAPVHHLKSHTDSLRTDIRASPSVSQSPIKLSY